jgi:hypothetical protein
LPKGLSFAKESPWGKKAFFAEAFSQKASWVQKKAFRKKPWGKKALCSAAQAVKRHLSNKPNYAFLSFWLIG